MNVYITTSYLEMRTLNPKYNPHSLNAIVNPVIYLYTELNKQSYI